MEVVEEKKGNAQENLNTVLGSIGTVGALGVLGGNGGLGNLFGGNRPQPPVPELATLRDLDYERKLTEKDAKIGQLEAQQYTDRNLVELERRVEDKFDKLEAQIAAQNQTQAVLNAHQSDAIAMAQGEIMRMKSVFNLYINQPTMAASEAVMTAFKTSAATASGSGTGA